MKSLVSGLAIRFSFFTFLMIVVLFSAFGINDYRSTSTNLHIEQQERVSLSVATLTDTVARALSAYDLIGVEVALKSAIQSPEISTIAVVDQVGIMGAFHKEMGEITPITEKEALASLALSRYPIYMSEGDEEPIGELLIQVDSSGIQKTLDGLIISVAIKMGGMALVIFLMSLLLITQLVSVPVQRVVSALKDMADGEADLTRRLPEKGRGEMAELAQYFNKFLSRIHDAIVGVSHANSQLTGTVSQMKEVVAVTSSKVALQGQEVDALRRVIQLVADSATGVTQQTEQGDHAAKAANDQAALSTVSVNEMGHAVAQLAGEFERAKENIATVQTNVVDISGVLGVIGDIAEQTNLLALNAAIEAARAGEQGRGFAVVADEVRALAARTQQSTEEIQTTIEQLQIGASKAVSVMMEGVQASQSAVVKAQETEDSIQTIAASILDLVTGNQRILEVVKEQSDGLLDTNQRIESIGDMAQETVAATEQALSASKVVESSAMQLSNLVENFKVNNDMS